MNATLIMDIGGTNTRCRITGSPTRTGDDRQHPVYLSKMITDKKTLSEFIRKVLSEYKLENRLNSVVLGFAGPVTDHARVVMTNWPQDQTILFSDLVSCGLPADRTILVNDLEAAAYGLLQSRHNAGNGEDTLPLYRPYDRLASANGNALLIMPGTGTGIAALIASVNSDMPQVLTCETQHAPIPALDAPHAVLIEKFRHISGKVRPSWEDFISGRGLESLYLALLNRDSGNKITLGAAAIAEMAVSGSDTVCRTALATYYRCTGALAQLLALTFLPYGGIYLAGNSTRNNISFIPDSAFIPSLHDNAIHKSLLERFPVFMVQADLNLDGAAYLEKQIPQKHSQISLFA